MRKQSNLEIFCVGNWAPESWRQRFRRPGEPGKARERPSLGVEVSAAGRARSKKGSGSRCRGISRRKSPVEERLRSARVLKAAVLKAG
ncbi:hypothetical protein PUN28_019428 [Cardiocondyla obscurior]|uniref:Uncharacterized protein n=1 Tax=Cardiocondyla obscurior TaxID=286306 RepID=A0AAW2EH93_9HYME